MRRAVQACDHLHRLSVFSVANCYLAVGLTLVGKPEHDDTAEQTSGLESRDNASHLLVLATAERISVLLLR
jgi:hypothetical protein